MATEKHKLEITTNLLIFIITVLCRTGDNKPTLLQLLAHDDIKKQTDFGLVLLLFLKSLLIMHHLSTCTLSPNNESEQKIRFCIVILV